MQVLLIFIIVNIKVWEGRCFPIRFGEQDCRVQIDNHRAELKQMIDNQPKFNMHNWSHAGIPIIIGALGVLLFCVHCFVRAKLQPVLAAIGKFSIVNKLHPQQQLPSTIIEKPVIIRVKDRNQDNLEEPQA
jgi:hypothetical protein